MKFLDKYRQRAKYKKRAVELDKEVVLALFKPAFEYGWFDRYDRKSYESDESYDVAEAINFDIDPIYSTDREERDYSNPNNLLSHNNRLAKFYAHDNHNPALSVSLSTIGGMIQCMSPKMFKRYNSGAKGAIRWHSIIRGTMANSAINFADGGTSRHDHYLSFEDFESAAKSAIEILEQFSREMARKRVEEEKGC